MGWGRAFLSKVEFPVSLWIVFMYQEDFLAKIKCCLHLILHKWPLQNALAQEEDKHASTLDATPHAFFREVLCLVVYV